MLFSLALLLIHLPGSLSENYLQPQGPMPMVLRKLLFDVFEIGSCYIAPTVLLAAMPGFMLFFL